MLKAYKYRIYPNNEQKIQIAKTFVSTVNMIKQYIENQKTSQRRKDKMG